MATRRETEAVPQQHRPGSVSGLDHAAPTTPPAHESGAAWLERFRETRGAQLLEFALALPFLVVIAVGIIDFGRAYNVQHILTNAAREAARITVSGTLTDAGGNCQNASPPCSIQAAADSVEKYLTNGGLSTASCITPGSASSSGTLTWTYSCNSVSLTINRGLVLAGGPSGTVIPSTQVTLSYPFTWSFSQVIGLLSPGSALSSSTSLPSTLTASAVMQNLD